MSIVDIVRDREEALELLRRVVRSGGPSAFQVAMSDAGRFLQRVEERDAKAKAENDAKEAQRLRRRTKGRDKSGAFEIAHKLEDGVDHSAQGVVLAKRAGLRLVWRYAGSYFSGRMRHYSPPELEVLYAGQRMPKSITNHGDNRTLGRGPRLSRDLILKHAEQIDSLFGQGVAAKVADLKATVDATR